MRTLTETHVGVAPVPVEDSGRGVTRSDDGLVRFPSDGFCNGQAITAGEWAALHASRYPDVSNEVPAAASASRVSPTRGDLVPDALSEPTNKKSRRARDQRAGGMTEGGPR